MKIKSLNIHDISSKSLLYYDEGKKGECLGVCNYLKIDYLPVVGKFEFAERKKDAFKTVAIHESIRVGDYQNVLDDDVKSKLSKAKHNVLFVTEGKVIKGVVHISDFNRNIVLEAIQQDMLSFERNLRQWYLLSNVKNEMIIDFFAYRSSEKKDEYWYNAFKKYSAMQKDGDLEKYGELQHFTLAHLLDFGNSSFSKKIFSTNDHIHENSKKYLARDIIIELRNTAMHAKDSIDTKNTHEIQTTNQLNKFYLFINAFIKKYELLEELIVGHEKHRRAIGLDNASKLKIIGEHYPNAIEFFIK